MARFIYQGTFQDGTGRAISDGTVTVYLAGTTTAATIYPAETGAADSDNTVTSASNGTFSFWIDDTGGYTAAQRFKLVLSKDGYTTQTWDNIAIINTYELASNAECVTGTAISKAVTPAGLTARLAEPGEIGGTAPGVVNASSVVTDTITEATGAAGVTIDGVTLKDGGALVVTGGTNTFNLTNGTSSLDIAAGKALDINDNLTVTAGYGVTLTAEDAAGTITLDNATLEIENANATQRAVKVVVGTDANATLTIEGTSAAVNQDVTSDASPTFASPTFTSPALGTPASGNLQNCTAATTSAKGVVELATSAESAAGASTTLVNTPSSTAAQIAPSANPKAMAQGVHMTVAGGGSNGIQVLDNAAIDFGTGSFTASILVFLPTWNPGATRYFFFKTAAGTGFAAYISAGDTLRLALAGGVFFVTTATLSDLADNSVHQIDITVAVGAVNTLVDFYIDKVHFDAQQTSANSASIDNSEPLYIMGSGSVRNAGRVFAARLFNRALSATEVGDLYCNGVSFADKGANQTAQTSGTLTTGKRYRINTYVASDDFTNIGGTNETGNEFVATGTTPTTWTNSSSLVQIGAVLELESEGIQSPPYKWLDASGNGLNATPPAAGASLARPTPFVGRYSALAVADLSDTATPSVLTSEETTGKLISNYKASGADHVFTMPAAHAAGNVIFIIGDEFQVDIEPTTDDLFYLNGTAMAANEHIQNTADTLGDTITGFCANINGTLRWMFKSDSANWVEETP